MFVGPCHHGMERFQVADGGTASDMEGSREKIEQAFADSRQGVVLEALTTPPLEKQMLRNIHRRDASSGDKTIRR